MSSSSIEWTGFTWNPVTGCDRISDGCRNCYALTMAKRLKAMGAAKYQNDGDLRTSGPGFGVAVHDDAMLEPLRWRPSRTVFVNSMSDVAHARVPRSAQAKIWAVMALTPRHQFQVLTKRPKRIATVLTDAAFYDEVGAAIEAVVRQFDGKLPVKDVLTARSWVEAQQRGRETPLANVWLGTSIESDDYAWRADELRRAPAQIRFLSCEPLLGPLPSLDLTDLGWVIAGGESGPNSRPMHPNWVRALRDQCQAERVAFFFKQHGEWVSHCDGDAVQPAPWGTRAPDAFVRFSDGLTVDSEAAAASTPGQFHGVWRVGKKASGRMLDGQVWDEMPQNDRPAVAS